MPKDRYSNFDELRRAERKAIDYRICRVVRAGSVAVIAPHGGKIEPGTSEVAAAIAGEAHHLYSFEGLRRRPHPDLHITSTNFDEPSCLELISSCDIVIAVHGLRGQDEAVHVGGRDKRLRDAINRTLRDAGFKAKIVAIGSHAAVSRDNICNQGRSGAGVQLELMKALRDALLKSPQKMVAFANSVHRAIGSIEGRSSDWIKVKNPDAPAATRIIDNQ
jgi:phage replication-related protein YjqB (UPF0714/DUF867 family)